MTLTTTRVRGDREHHGRSRSRIVLQALHGAAQSSSVVAWQCKRAECVCVGHQALRHGHALAHLLGDVKGGAGSGVLNARSTGYFALPGEGVSPELVCTKSACPLRCAPKHAVAGLAASRRRATSENANRMGQAVDEWCAFRAR